MVDKIVLVGEGPCGIAVSMHCRITAFLGEVNETCRATWLRTTIPTVV